MKKFLDQLKPQERRWVIGLGAGAFLLLNYVFIWPHFKDWGAADVRKNKSLEKHKLFSSEIAHKGDYERLIHKYESEGGLAVPAEDQMEQFVFFCQNAANTYSVNIQNNSQPHTYTNSPFFVDREMSFTVLAREDNLVSFLYTLGSSNSVMRVRAMSVRPDGPHQQLSANVTILASYQKKAPAPAPAASAKGTPAPAANKPAATKSTPPLAMPGRTDNKPVVPKPGNTPRKPGQSTDKLP